MVSKKVAEGLDVKGGATFQPRRFKSPSYKGGGAFLELTNSLGPLSLEGCGPFGKIGFFGKGGGLFFGGRESPPTKLQRGGEAPTTTLCKKGALKKKGSFLRVHTGSPPSLRGENAPLKNGGETHSPLLGGGRKPPPTFGGGFGAPTTKKGFWRPLY